MKKQYVIHSGTKINGRGNYFIGFESSQPLSTWSYADDLSKAYLFNKASDVTLAMKRMHFTYMKNTGIVITLRHYLKKFDIKRITKEEAIIKNIIE